MAPETPKSGSIPRHSTAAVPPFGVGSRGNTPLYRLSFMCAYGTVSALQGRKRKRRGRMRDRPRRRSDAIGPVRSRNERPTSRAIAPSSLSFASEWRAIPWADPACDPNRILALSDPLSYTPPLLPSTGTMVAAPTCRGNTWRSTRRAASIGSRPARPVSKASPFTT